MEQDFQCLVDRHDFLLDCFEADRRQKRNRESAPVWDRNRSRNWNYDRQSKWREQLLLEKEEFSGYQDVQVHTDADLSCAAAAHDKVLATENTLDLMWEFNSKYIVVKMPHNESDVRSIMENIPKMLNRCMQKKEQNRNSAACSKSKF